MTTLQAPAVLIEGAPGSGKTDSIVSLVQNGIETFVISTEPDGISSLIDSCARRKADLNLLHWTSVLPATSGWTALDSMVTNIANKSYEDLASIKSGIGKDKTREPATKLLKALQNFHCERTGQDFGDVSTWTDERALVLDSLSGLSQISWALVLGYKPAAHQGEWGVAMNFIEQLLLKLNSDRKCYFVLTAHVEKETNELTGVQQVMASTLGRKLAPKIPRYFSEVVWARRTLVGTTAAFTWATVDSGAELKSRALPIGITLPADFTPIVEAHKRRRQSTEANSPQASAAPSAA